MNDKGQQFYEYLKSINIEVPASYEEFQSAMQDQNTADQFYEFVKSQNVEVPETSAEFSSVFTSSGGADMGFTSGSQEPQEQPTEPLPSSGIAPYASEEQSPFYFLAPPKKDKKTPYDIRKNSVVLEGNTEPSTVLMSSGEVDGKFVAFPTLFPKDPNNQTSDPKDWIQPEGWSAYDEAKKRGEVWEFKTEEEANRFAEGGWKTQLTMPSFTVEDREKVPQFLQDKIQGQDTDLFQIIKNNAPSETERLDLEIARKEGEVAADFYKDPEAVLGEINKLKEEKEIYKLPNLIENGTISDYNEIIKGYDKLNDNQQESFKNYLLDFEKREVLPQIDSEIENEIADWNYATSADKDGFPQPNTIFAAHTAGKIAKKLGLGPKGENLVYQRLLGKTEDYIHDTESQKIIDEKYDLTDPYVKKRAEEFNRRIAAPIELQAQRDAEIVMERAEKSIANINNDYNQKINQAQSNIHADLTQSLANGEISAEEFERLFQASYRQAATDLQGERNARLDEINNQYAANIYEIDKNAFAAKSERYKEFEELYGLNEIQQKYLNEITQKASAEASLRRNELKKLSEEDQSIYWKNTFYAISNMLSGASQELGMPSAVSWFDGIKYAYTPAKYREYGGGEDLNYFWATAGNLTGSVATTMPASFAAAQVPYVGLITGGLAGWGAETLTMVGNMYNDTLKRTGSIAEAENAADQMYEAQVSNMILYSFDALPFVGKALSRLKVGGAVTTAAARVAVGGAVDTIFEFGQELKQTAQEQAISETGQYKNYMNYINSDLARSTFYQIAPTFLLGGAGQALSMTGEYYSGRKAGKEFTKDEVTDYVKAVMGMSNAAPDVVKQVLYNTYLKNGATFTYAMIGSMQQSGVITTERAQELANIVKEQGGIFSTTSALNLTPQQSIAYYSILDKYNQIKAQAEAIENDDVAKELVMKRANEYKKSATEFLENPATGGSFINVLMPNGNDAYLSAAEFKDFVAQEGIAEMIVDGKIKYQYRNIEGIGQIIEDQLVQNFFDKIKAQNEVQGTVEAEEMTFEKAQAEVDAYIKKRAAEVRDEAYANIKAEYQIQDTTSAGVTDGKAMFNNVTRAIAKGESVNENDLNQAREEAYAALMQLEDKTSEEAEIMRSLIEDEIEKIEAYDNITTTETRKITKETTTTTVTKTPRKTEPLREKEFVGKKAVFSDNKGGGGRGVIEIQEGPDGNQYYVLSQQGEDKGQFKGKIILGRRDRLFNEGQVNFDANNNPVSITFTTTDGKQITIKSPEIAMEFELEKLKQQEYDEQVFTETYIEFVGEEQVEVKKLKEKKDAIQEQTAGQVPVQPEAGVSETMEGGKPQPKSEEATKANQEKTEEVTEGVAALRGKFGAPVAPAKLQTVIDKALKALAKIAPNVQIIVASTAEHFAVLDGDRGAYQNGIIYIDPNKANARTVAHEVFHAILLRDGKTDAQAKVITDRMMQTLRKVAPKELLDKLDAFASNYDSPLQSEESIAELFGMIAEAYETLNDEGKSAIRKWLDGLVKALGLDKLVGSMLDQTDKEVIDFLNTVAKKVAVGEEITAEDVTVLGEGDGNVAEQVTRFHADFSDPVSKMTFIYDKNTKKFKRLRESGYITTNKSITEFNGKYVFFHQPDAAFSGLIYKNGQLLVEGKGGMYYPIKFHEDGYFWASTDSAALKMASDLNKVYDQNKTLIKDKEGNPILDKNGNKQYKGVIYMALTSAPRHKLFSSTTMSNAVLDFFSSKAFDKNFSITPAQLKRILNKTAKYVEEKRTLIKDKEDNPILDENGNKQYKIKTVGLGLKFKSNNSDSIEDVKSKIKELLNPDITSFDDRKVFVTQLIKETADIIKANPEAVQQFGSLFSEGIQNKYFKGVSKTGKLSISAANMSQALAEMFTEPILKDDINREKGGQIYAILELSGRVKPEDSNKHESYPKAIVADGGKVKLHILKDRVQWSDVTEDFETGELVSDERKLKVFPTSGVSVRGLKINTSKVAQVTNLARKQRVEKAQKETNFVPVSFWVESLKGNVDYLDNVVEHILKAREILKSGNVPQRMTTKSYLITLASMGSGGGYYENWKAKTGRTVDDIFIEKQNGRDWLRPEGAAAAFLSTEEGKSLVDKINKGTATKEEIKEIFDFVGTGRESSKAGYVVSTMQDDGLKSMTDLFNKNKGTDFSELFNGAIKYLKGIGEGKTGFFNQYFGVSSRGVVDARQMNAWVAGSMKLTDEQKQLKRKIESSKKLQAELLRKIEEVGIELGYAEDLAAYIAHHAIWDGIANNITRHEGEYQVTRKQKPSIQEVLDYAKANGISKSDVKAYLAELGYTTKEISDAMPRGIRPPSARRITGQPKPKKVTIQEMTALKSQIRMEARAARGAVKAIKEIRAQIQAALETMVKSGKISSKQLNSILRKLNRMNLLNPDMRERFINYMEKVYNNADYIEKISQANSARTKIKKLAKSKTVDAVVAESAKLFAKVDPQMVENIDEYNKIAEEVLSGLRKTTFNAANVADYANTQIEIQDKINLERVRKAFEEVTGIDAKDLTYDQMMALIDVEDNAKELETKAKEVRTAAEKYFNLYSSVVDEILKGTDPFTGEAVELDEYQADLVRRLINLDLDTLNTKELATATRMLMGFVENGRVGGIEKLVQNKEGAQKAKTTRPRIIKKLSAILSKRLGRLEARGLTSLTLLFEKKFGGFTEGQKIKSASGVSGLIKAANTVKKMVDTVIVNYYDKFGKTKPNGEVFNSLSNNIERGMYAAMKRTYNGTEAEQKAEFERKKGLIKDAIAELKLGDEKQKIAAEIYERKYISLLANAKNINDVEAKINPINKQAVEYWVENFAAIKPQLDDVSLSMYNTLLENDLFYTPDVYKLVTKVEEIVDDKESGFFNISGKQVIAPGKAGQLKQINRPSKLKDRYISLDFDTNMANAFNAGLMDIYTAPHISFIKGFMNSTEGKAIFGTREDYQLFVERINDYIKAKRGQARFSNQDVGKIVDLIGKLGAARALGSLTQPIRQVVPVALNTIFNADPQNFFTAARLISTNLNVNKLLDNSGYAIANRGASATMSIESMNKQIDKLLAGPASKLNIFSELSENLLEKVLVKPDVMIARASWVAYYLQNLKKQGINTDNINWETHKLNDQAAEYAQDMVDRQQNVSDQDLQGKLFTDSTSSTKFIRATLFPFSTFILNQKERMYSDIMTLSPMSTASYEDRVIALKSLIGLIGEISSFTAIRVGLSELIFLASAAMVGHSESDEDKKRRRNNLIKGAYTNFVSDLFSPLPSITDVAVMEAVNAMSQGTIGEDVVFTPRKQNFEDAFGTLGIVISKGRELSHLLDMAIDGKYTREQFGKEIEIALNSKEQNQAQLASVLVALHVLGLPSEFGTVGKNIGRIIENRAKDRRKETSKKIKKPSIIKKPSPFGRRKISR